MTNDQPPTTTSHQPSPKATRALRYVSAGVVGMIWLFSVGLLVSGWLPGTYLGLELAWALPPILLQLGFGADILWRHRRLVCWVLAPSTIYLCMGDALAIGSGTWTINPARSSGLLLGNLPVEEIIFFLATNTLVVFGMVLVLAKESQLRAPTQLTAALARLVRQKPSVRIDASAS